MRSGQYEVRLAAAAIDTGRSLARGYRQRRGVGDAERAPRVNATYRDPSLISISPSGHGSTSASTQLPSYKISNRVPGGWRGLLATTTVNGVGSTVSSLSVPSRLTTTVSSRNQRWTVAEVPSVAPGLRTATRAPSPQPYASHGLTRISATLGLSPWSRQSRRKSIEPSACKPSCTRPCSEPRYQFWGQGMGQRGE